MSTNRAQLRTWPLFLVIVLPLTLLAALNNLASMPIEAIAALPSADSIPTTPPDVALISVSAPDASGYAIVTGDPGAVPPNADVAIVNLKARNLITTTADGGGAFAASLFAPPGSALHVKYEVGGDSMQQLWHDAFLSDPSGVYNYMNMLPGAIIQVSEQTPFDGQFQPFRAVGSFQDDAPRTWAGWWLSGTLQAPTKDQPSLTAQPGQTITITAQLKTTSPVITCTDPPTYTIWADIDLRYMFDADGAPYYWGNWFDNFLFTPTGLPIEHNSGGESESIATLQYVTNLACINDRTLSGDLQATFQVPPDFPTGIFQPIISIAGNVPRIQTKPVVLVWYDPSVTDLLPPIRVGAPAEPRIPWTLLVDYPVNGVRGLQARENEGRYSLNTWVTYPPHPVVIPPTDERTGQPLTYRLEPGSNWLSGTDRRFPNPPIVPLFLPSGSITVEIDKPDGQTDVLGPVLVRQPSTRAPTLKDGTHINFEGGSLGDVYHLYTKDDAFAYQFEQYGPHVIRVTGFVEDLYGNRYSLDSTYDVMVGRVLDLDPAQLPAMPYLQGGTFAPGLHVFPPVPADVHIEIFYLPYSNPPKVERIIDGQANRFGYFHPAEMPPFVFELPGEYRVDISAQYESPDGTFWFGSMTWGSIIEGADTMIKAHGRRGMNYPGDIKPMSAWFIGLQLPTDKRGPDTYYPYFSGDIHWGHADALHGGDSILPAVTIEDSTAFGTITGTYYNVMKESYPRTTTFFRPPPMVPSFDGLIQRLEVHEAPLFLATRSGSDPAVAPDEIELWGYWYGASERPDVRVRELATVDNTPTAYWRFDDTYSIQIGEPADGDHPGDLKWEFGGIVFRVISETNPINEYAAYSSLWTLLPNEDMVGTRIAPPFRGTTGSGFDAGPIFTYTLDSQTVEVDMLFLPKGIRPGDILELGDIVSFSGHVGPPLDSRVEVTITSPSGVTHSSVWHANRIGWIYDPSYDFVAEEPGRWTVDVLVEHDRPYIGDGHIPTQYNSGTVMGTTGRYSFYVVGPDTPRLLILDPESGFFMGPADEIGPVVIQGIAPPGATDIFYTFHDKGVVMGQGSVPVGDDDRFTLVYNPLALHEDFSMLSLTAHDEKRAGLADEVTISLLAAGAEPLASHVTLIGEEIFVDNARYRAFLPITLGD